MSVLLANSAHAIQGFDVNDVAILLPVTADSSDVSVGLRLDSRNAAGEALLPKSIFDQIIPQVAFHQPFPIGSAANYADYRIVAVRIDPCAPDPAAPVKECRQALRLTAQPFHSAVSSATVTEGAFHIVYFLGTGALNLDSPLVADLQKIRDVSGSVTAGLVLGAHPGLAKEPAAGAVRGFVEKWATAARLSVVTFIVRAPELNWWRFYRGQVHGGNWTVDPIPGARGSLDQLTTSLFEGFLSGAVRDAVPNLFLDSDHWGFDGPVPAAAIPVFHELMNPLKSNMANRDCVSCHTAAIGIRQFRIPFSGAPIEFVNPVGITGFAELATDQGGLAPCADGAENCVFPSPFLLGYSKLGVGRAELSISALAANAAAASANKLNTMLGLANPSPRDCSDRKIRECFLGRLDGASPTAANCLAFCPPAKP